MTVDRRPQVTVVGAGGDRPGRERRERPGGVGVRLAQRDLEPCAADLPLELRRGAGGDGAAVVDDHDLVGQFIGLIEILGGKQQRRPVGDQRADHLPHPQPAGRVQAGRRLVEEQHRRPGRPAPPPGRAGGASHRSSP